MGPPSRQPAASLSRHFRAVAPRSDVPTDRPKAETKRKDRPPSGPPRPDEAAIMTSGVVALASSVATEGQEAIRKEWLGRLADEVRASWQGGQPTDTSAFLDRYPEL